MAKQVPLYSPKEEQQIMVDIWTPEIAYNPYNFALYAYPWGKKNTPLENMKGPRGWQKEMMEEMTAFLRTNQLKGIQQLPLDRWNSAVASGRGIGKSAFVAFVAHWMMSVYPGSTTIITANTEQQLRSRTMAELGKWHSLAINKHWFEMETMILRPAEWYSQLMVKDRQIDPKYWYAGAQTWSEDNPDAFAGIHNMNGVALIFDEASGIPSPIWSASEGFFTEPTPNRFWFTFSNPRRNSGAFFECFHKNRNFWKTKHIDSRTIEGTDIGVFNRIIEQYGIDSDEARIEVLGQFPNVGANQFIPKSTITDAQAREPQHDPGAPLLMGVDVARFGEDRSVIAFRQGRNANVIPWQTFKKLNTVELAGKIADAAGKYNPNAIMIDGGGVGGGVVDSLRSWGYKVIEVQAGESATNSDAYLNKRVEMWALMKDWLHTASIPDIQELYNDLMSPEFDYHPTNHKLQLESKKAMKKRGLASPDLAEALAMTFAQPVARQDQKVSRYNTQTRQVMCSNVDYDIFGVD